MGKLISMKIESLKQQLDLLKSELEKKEKMAKFNGGLRKLKGALKGKGNFSDEEITKAKASFSEKP